MALWLVRLSVSIIFIASTCTCVVAGTPTTEELWQLIQAQQQQLDRLTYELESSRQALDGAVAKLEQSAQRAQATNTHVAEMDARIEATADMLEQVAGSDVSVGDALQLPAPQGSDAVGAGGGRLAPSVGLRKHRGARWAERTALGGYGELHYNNLTDNQTNFDGDADDLDRVDFHRFVLFASHEFNDWVSFAAELEVEHSLASDGAPGAVEIELAWVELDVSESHHVRAGLDILPVGLINLTHEPNTFYGVERNRVESEIIPSTWWEASLAMWGEIAPGWGYNAYVHSGLVIPTTGGSAFRPRSGRLKAAEADDQDIAFLGRLLYTGMPGLEIALTFDYENDYTGTADAADVDAWLFEGHIDYKHSSGLGLRALYARWDLSGDVRAGVDPERVNADILEGWYIEPAYRFSTANWFPGEIGIFARYEQWDERNGLGGGAFRFERFSQFVSGVNYWPHPQVVFKFDAQWQDAKGPVERELDGVNLGVGYQF